MKTLNILAFSLIIASSYAHAVNPLPPKPFKTPLQREMDLRGFREGLPADTLANLVENHSLQCLTELNTAGNIVVFKKASKELIVKVRLLHTISRQDWQAVYDHC